MHEMSIALSIVEIAEEEIERNGGHVTAVHLRLGKLSGIVPEALRSSYDLACADSPLEGSRLEIEEVPIAVYCEPCGQVRELESAQLFCCSHCGTPSGDVRQGKELQVVALEVEE